MKSFSSCSVVAEYLGIRFHGGRDSLQRGQALSVQSIPAEMSHLMLRGHNERLDEVLGLVRRITYPRNEPEALFVK